MSYQQLLLILVGVIIVGIAIAVGISLFSEHQKTSSLEAGHSLVTTIPMPNSNDMQYKIVQIRGCEYIVFALKYSSSSTSPFVVHASDCSNPNHKTK